MKGILLLTSFLLLTSCNAFTLPEDGVIQTSDELNIETVPIEEFPHSEYMLMVEEEKYPSGAEYIPEYMYAFLGDGIHSLDEGRKFYAQINGIYAKTYPTFVVDPLPRGAEIIEKFNKYFFERRVIQVSEDGQRVLCFSYQDNEENKEVFDWGRWNIVFEVFEDDELIYSYNVERYAAIGTNDRSF